jgi:hypothetical protein
MSILAAVLTAAEDGFLKWEDVIDALQREPWRAFFVDRHDQLPVALHTTDSGALVVYDDELVLTERAALCAMRFSLHRLPRNTAWFWLPPSSERRPRPGRAELLRNVDIARARVRERNRKTPRVLRDVFHATPDQLTLVLEPSDLENADDVTL